MQEPPAVVPVAPPTLIWAVATVVWMRMPPLFPLPRARVPVTSVPMKLPVIVVTVVSDSSIWMPPLGFPEMRLLAMVVLGEPGEEVRTPAVLPTAAVPAGLVPILLAVTTVPEPKQDGAQNWDVKRPPPPLPEMTLPAPAAAPPTTVLLAKRLNPANVLGSAADPLAVVPT